MTARAMPALEAGDALCKQCGLCCDGTFFGGVPVAAHERRRLERVGLRVLGDGEAMELRLPCASLRGCLCTVYADRPSACVRYECALRKSVDANRVNVEDALAKVSRMRELLATLRAAIGGAGPLSIWRRILLLEEAAAAEPTSDVAHPHESALAAVDELLELGRADFEPRFSGGTANEA